MRQKFLGVRWMFLGVILIGVAFVYYLSWATQDLQKVQASLVKKYPGVDHLQIEALAQYIQTAPDGFILFDVRERVEYDISHLPGAVWVEPGMERTAFLTAHGPKLAGKTAVFYCSVGVRSSGLLARVQNDLSQQGAVGTYNLTGGIFAWHNQSRGLVNGQSTTDMIHPYNQHWGKLIKRRTHIRYEPVP